ncbi:MAG: 4a-hydroxytetrahydrobiopterin dehydratase [Actinomycetota bacterium]|nr:4a-hydroxytetrahydrobiopterin dehydratase [Actinomycetota bacterium]
MATKLTDDAVRSALAEIDGWEVVDEKVHRELKFSNFSEAFGFMSRVALIAEKLDHHPEWFNVWATVRIDLTTHSVDGISDLDLEFARKVNDLL